FKLIRYAYDILSDPSRRVEYDEYAGSHVERSHAPAGPETAQHERRPASAPDVRRRVYITLDEQLRGGRVELQVSRTEYCTACTGSGTSANRVSCVTCSGDGYVRPSFG